MTEVKSAEHTADVEGVFDCFLVYNLFHSIKDFT